ncbi:hypothetical protein ACHAW6_008524 [Cyclotella cf. meneghiniana]
MVTSLDNLAMATIQKNETVEKLIKINYQKDHVITSLTESFQAEKATNGKLLELITKTLQPTQAVPIKLAQSGGRWDPNGYCWSRGYKCNQKHNSKTCHTRKEHQTGATRCNSMGGTQDNKDWKPKSQGKPAREFNYDLNLNHVFINLLKTTPACTNSQNLNTTALPDTGANISLLQMGAPAVLAKPQTAPKCITQPKGSLVTTENPLGLLNKLPVQARNAHRAPGIFNNLLALS